LRYKLPTENNTKLFSSGFEEVVEIFWKKISYNLNRPCNGRIILVTELVSKIAFGAILRYKLPTENNTKLLSSGFEGFSIF
jgi:hypothetical protein